MHTLGFVVTIENFPLYDCHNRGVDLLLVAQFQHRPTQTLRRLTNIVNYFIEYDQRPDRSVTVSVLHSVTWQTLLNFTDIMSTEEAREHFNKMIILKEDQHDGYNRLNFNNIVHLFTFIMRDRPRDDSVKLVVLLTRCTDQECDFNFGSSKDDLRYELKNINFMVVNSGDIEMIKTMFSDELYESNAVNLAESDALDDINILSVKLCGHCAKNWTFHQSVKHPRQRSCYLFNHKIGLMSWNQANDVCQLMDSSLLNIETNDEFDFIKQTLETQSTVMFMEEITLHIGLRFKITGLYKRIEWSNRRPLVLKSDIIRNMYSDHDDKSCWSLVYYIHITLNASSSNFTLNVRSKKLQCDLHFASTSVCEKNVPIAFLERRDNFKSSSPRAVKVDGFYLFDCGEGRGHVHYYQVCDGQIQCKGGRDEEYCYRDASAARLRLSKLPQPSDHCGFLSSTFADTIYATLPNDLVCDGFQDCHVQNEEESCGKCVNETCYQETCHITYKPKSTPGGTECFSKFRYLFQFCDGRKTLLPLLVETGELMAPFCVYTRILFGSPARCPDMSNLLECETYSCPEGFVKCPSSYCVPIDYVNDNIIDCPYGEDEEMGLSFDDMFLQECYVSINGKRPIGYCDGVVDCDNYADEMNCQICFNDIVCRAGVAVAKSNQFYLLATLVNNLTRVLHLSGVDILDFKRWPIYFDDLFEVYMSNCRIINDTSLMRFMMSAFNSISKVITGSWTNENVYKIDLSYNLLTLITRNSFFSKLLNLQFLSLEHNLNLELIEDESFLSKRLKVLNLSFTRIASLPYSLLKFSLLEEIVLHNTKITSVDWLPRGVILKSLDIRNNSIDTHAIHSIDVLNSVVITRAMFTDHFQLCCPQIAGRGIPRHLCHSPSDAVSSCDDLLADTAQCLLLWVVAVVSVVGNLAVVLYRFITSALQFSRAFGVFVFNLGIADFIMGVYLLIIASVDVYYRGGYVLYESKWRHSYLCKVAGFLSTLSSEASNFFVLFITMDRYLAVRFPFGQFSFTKISHFVVVILTWFITLFLALLPLLKTEWVIYSSNGMCLGLHLTNHREVGWEYSFSVFICLNFLLFVLIAVGQVAIYRSMSVQSSNQTSQRRKQDIDIAQQLILVATTNLLCWLPDELNTFAYL
ncbi:hypothetical protein Btru_056746 [Bulinus truncatus]|nr:hypothetical protein Btru_056746 [Bulinus truncatus]